LSLKTNKLNNLERTMACVVDDEFIQDFERVVKSNRYLDEDGHNIPANNLETGNTQSGMR